MGVVPILLIIFGIAIVVGAYLLGSVVGQLKVTRQSPDGLAINKAVEEANFPMGKKIYTNDERQELIRRCLSLLDYLARDIETENQLLESQQKRNNDLKDLLTK